VFPSPADRAVRLVRETKDAMHHILSKRVPTTGGFLPVALLCLAAFFAGGAYRAQAGLNTWSKAGVMIRDTLNPDAKHMDVVVAPGQGFPASIEPIPAALQSIPGRAGLDKQFRGAPFLFTDPATLNFNQRFYRVIIGP